MDYVSVDTTDFSIYVKWKPSPSDTLDRYIIWEWQQVLPGFPDSAFFEVGNVGSNTLEFLYQGSDASEKPVKITVTASWDGWEPSPLADPHTTMYLIIRYDSCRKEMMLDWTPYLGWDSAQYVMHEIYVNVDDGSYEKLTITDADSTRCLHIGLADNHQYCYFVKAIRSDGVASFSNIACMLVQHPLHPLWINAEQASAMGEDQINVDFYIEESAEVTSYRLYRRTGAGKPLIPLQDFTDVSGPTLSYADQDPFLSTAKQYQYQLYSLDVCGDSVVGSNIAGNIVLRANSAALQAFLSWTPYKDYETGVKSYHVYRITNMGDPQQVYEAGGTDTAYTDNLDFVSGSDIEDDICYYVVGEENDSFTRGGKGISQSNTTCISVTPEILMPNAFTPNDDGRNDIIKPVLTFIPEKYIYQVFDRWGSRIFETTDPEEGWDGSISGNGKASEGVYIYYILLTTSKGIEVEQRGEITLFYP